jgi:AcrR family transcriptional regulator
MNQVPRGEETRSRILEAAAECFARHGYDASGVAEICQHAGVTKGAFYHHFPTKQAVFLELLNQWLKVLDAQLATAQVGATTVPERFIRMADMAQHVFQMADGRLPMFLEFLIEARHDPAIWQAVIAPYRQYRAFFADIIRAGVAEGTLQPVDPEIAAQVVVSLAVGLVSQGVFDPTGADWGQVTQKGIQILLDGLETQE